MPSARAAVHARRVPARLAQSWRVTTAVRVFALALATGQVLDAGSLSSAGVVLLGLAIVGAACCGCELHGTRGRTPWVAIAEGVMVSLLIGSAGDAVEPLLVYLAIPAVVAGISHGRLATTNTSLASVLTLVAAVVAGLSRRARSGAAISTALPWLVIGLGAGLLAATQTRSLRRLEAAQAPYAAAHRLVGQLHTLVRELPMALDVATHATALQDCGPRTADADTLGGARPHRRRTSRARATHGSPVAGDEEAAPSLRRSTGNASSAADAVAFPLRVGQHVFGAVVLGRLDTRVRRRGSTPSRSSSTSTRSGSRPRCSSTTSAPSPRPRSATGSPATSTTASPSGSCRSATSPTRSRR